MFFQPMFLIVLFGLTGMGLAIFQFWKVKNKRQRIHWTLRGVAALMILFAGLRPSVPSLAPAELYNNQYDVYFVVDLTSSMVAEDWDSQKDPRLDGVREDINDLLDDYAGAKFSLITFNSTASLRVPLTPDSTAIASAANTMLPEVTAYSQGSSISKPLDLMKSTLAADKETSDRAKIVLYFGDGEQTDSSEPASFAPIKPYVTQAKVYGYGTSEGGRMKQQTGYYISTKDDKYIKDGSGKDGISVIDESNLKTMATQMGGTYEHRTPNKRIAAATLNNDQKLNLQKQDGASVNNTSEFYWIFLIPASLLFLIEAGYLFRTARYLGVKFK